MILIKNFQRFLKLFSICLITVILISLFLYVHSKLSFTQLISLLILAFGFPIFLYVYKVSYFKGHSNLRNFNRFKTKLKIQTRTCFLCQNHLVVEDYFLVNIHENIEYLANLWNNPKIELICCDCYLEINNKNIIDLLNLNFSLQ